MSPSEQAPHKRHLDQDGFALIQAVVAAVIAASLMMSMMVYSHSMHSSSLAEKHRTVGHYLAEGAIELVKLDLRSALSNGMPAPTTGSVAIDGHTIDYTVTELSKSTDTDPSGFEADQTYYEIAAVTRVAGTRAASRRMVSARSTHIFQYGVFYEDTLDISPSPPMTLTGRIHTNGDLRTGSNVANTITYDTNSIRAVGQLLRVFGENMSPTIGTVRIRKWVQDPFNTSEPVEYTELESQSQLVANHGITTVSGYDSRFTGFDSNGDSDYDDPGDWKPFDAGMLERYAEPGSYGTPGVTLRTGATGATRAVPPSVGSIAMFEPDPAGDHVWSSSLSEYVKTSPGAGTHSKGFYHDKAGLTVVVDASGSSWRAYDVDGIDRTGDVSAAITLEDVYDHRQGGFVKTAKVDIGALSLAGRLPTNGLLYVAHYGMGIGTDARGVLLTNGSAIATDLTVATSGSAYLHGDYNTVAPKSAAVISDALNLLSNAWTNTTAMGLGSPTTFNVAIVTGHVPMAPGVYNGALENLPRFHEDWTGKDGVLRGSIVCLWDCRYATAQFTYDHREPPNRHYLFDPRFNDVSELPPFTPRAIELHDVATY